MKRTLWISVFLYLLAVAFLYYFFFNNPSPSETDANMRRPSLVNRETSSGASENDQIDQSELRTHGLAIDEIRADFRALLDIASEGQDFANEFDVFSKRFDDLSEAEAVNALTEIVSIEREIAQDASGDLHSMYVLSDPIVAHKVLPKLETNEALSAILPGYEPGQGQISEVTEVILEHLWGRGSPPEFDAFSPFLEEHSSEPQMNLIEWMYRSSSKEALRVVGALYITGGEHSRIMEEIEAINYDLSLLPVLGQNEAESILSRATPILNKLSLHSEWSVRIFVAARLEQIPELRTSQIIENLLNDQSPTIRELVMSFSDDSSIESRNAFERMELDLPPLQQSFQ